MIRCVLFFSKQIKYCVINLKLVPLILLVFIIPSTAYAHEVIFSDDFNRGESNSVGNGWNPYYAKQAGAIAYIEGDVLFLDGDKDTSQRPCVYHQFDIPASAEYVQVNFTYNFAPLPNEVEYDDTNGFQFNMRLGENMDCRSGVTERFFDLFHAGSANKPNVSVNGSFGHFTGISSRSSPAIVNGLVDISILINNNDDVFSYNVTGDVFDIDTGNPSDIKVQNVPYLNNVVVNSTFIKLSHIQTAVEIDDFTVSRLDGEIKTCGISVDSTHGFGYAKPGFFTAETQIELVGTGSTDSTVFVYAGDWINGEDQSGDNIINVENTRFSTVPETTFFSKTALDSNQLPLEIDMVVPHHGSLITYWESQLIVNEDHVGKVRQTMSFEAQC